jgi:hypothetical protein
MIDEIGIVEVVNFTSHTEITMDPSSKEIANTEIVTTNPDVFAKLYSERDTTDWLVGIRALRDVRNFILGPARNRLILETMKTLTYNRYLDEKLFNEAFRSKLAVLGATDDQLTGLWADTTFGFGVKINILKWGGACGAYKSTNTPKYTQI